MSQSHKTLVLIAARGGSKGLPRKNIAQLGGAPLIAWAIAAARQTPAVTDVVVSTDDEEIAKVSRDWGAEVPFLRPSELAQDSSPVADAYSYTLNRLSKSYDTVVNLFPSHPFRSPAMLQEAIEASYNFSLGVGSAICETNEPGDFVFLGAEGPQPVLSASRGRILRSHALFSISSHRPAHVYSATGYNHYIARAREINAGQNRFLVPEHYFFINDPVTLTDIDSAADLAQAEAFVHAGKVQWTPRDTVTSNERFRFPQQITPALLQPYYQIVTLDSGTHVSMKLPANPLVMEPAELRHLLNHDEQLADKAVIIAVGDAPMHTSTLSSLLHSGGPSIAAELTTKIALGSGIAHHTLAYGLLFCAEQVSSQVGYSVGDIPARVDNGQLIVELLPFEKFGTYCSAIAYDADFRVTGRSSFFDYTGETWTSRPQNTARMKSFTITLTKDSRGYLLRVPEGTAAVQFHVFRPGSHEPARGYTWDPVEFPGVYEFEHASHSWRNCLDNSIVTGRQNVPPIYRWSGHVYLPKNVSSSTPWSITWQHEKARALIGEANRLS